MSKFRPVYSGSQMRRLFSPESIAIVGASARPGSFGARTVQNLARFNGELHLVNPRYEEIGGRRCYASIADLPDAPDCAVIVTAKDTVEPLVASAIAAGVGGIVLYASGFAELGAGDYHEAQTRLGRMAAEAGVPLIGPNAIGFVNFALGAGVTFLTGLELELGYDCAPGRRRIGLVSQSGALGFCLGQGIRHGHFFSHVLSCGNSADVDVADAASYLIDEPSCEVITCVLEGLPDPRRLEEVAWRASAANKPLLVCKMARGESGASAAASHTGSLAGSHAAFTTMIERAGGVMIDAFESLLETAAFFAKAKRPVAEGAAVIATSGGAAILAADAADAAGVPLPQPAIAVRDTLLSHIPEFGSARNPCDVTAEVLNNTQSLIACVNALLEQEDYGTLVVPHPLAYASALPRIAILDGLARDAGKIICSVWLSQWLEGPGAEETEAAQNLALFRSMGRCFDAIAAWNRWQRRDRAGSPARPDTGRAARERAAGILNEAGGRIVGEKQAKQILELYGVPVVSEALATTAQDARELAASMPLPLVMKIDSPDLPHKTEIGGVALNLATPEEVAAEFEAMTQRVHAARPDARIDGVLLQPMVPKGVEIVVGARHDPAFGSLILVGIGGVLVELLQDTVTAPAPVTARQAADMLRKLKMARIFDGFRDLPAVDVERLADIVTRISDFAADHQDRIDELDINPLICNGSTIIAVDALIVRKG